jgi:hypothetical protein
MIVSIHQPQYLPWIPYFLKVDESDVFILLDSVDFQKNGLQNRNQIKNAHGPLWLTVPVKHQFGQKINEVELDGSGDWRKKHWQTICQSYGKSGAFNVYAPELESFYLQEWSSLSELDIALFTLMVKWLGVDCSIRRSSEMQATGKASTLVLNLCLEAGATRYVSGTGGHGYLNEAEFQEAGIEVVFRPPVLPARYPQQYPKAGFIDSLSALDMILNCGLAWREYMPAQGRPT